MNEFIHIALNLLVYWAMFWLGLSISAFYQSRNPQTASIYRVYPTALYQDALALSIIGLGLIFALGLSFYQMIFPLIALVILSFFWERPDEKTAKREKFTFKYNVLPMFLLWLGLSFSVWFMESHVTNVILKSVFAVLIGLAFGIVMLVGSLWIASKTKLDQR